jgi:lipopolysaccharide biosynthesis regulator YciM
MDLLVSYLASYADLAALERLLELRKRGNEPGDAGGKAIHEAVLGVVRELRGRQPDYSCGHCGFAARHLHWQCPSCKHWGSIEPAHPLPIGGRTRASPERRIA